MWKLFDHEPYMQAQRTFCQTEELAILRTAAILRNPGSAPLPWHSDFCGFSNGARTFSGDVLNRGPWHSGLWFYITGSRPIHGGLAVIEDSHIEGWQGPEGFQLTPDQRSFHRPGSEPHRHVGFDVPGVVPIFADPCDQIVFASRTYHAAFPNRIDRVRLSCAIISARVISRLKRHGPSHRTHRPSSRLFPGDCNRLLKAMSASTTTGLAMMQ